MPTPEGSATSSRARCFGLFCKAGMLMAQTRNPIRLLIEILALVAVAQVSVMLALPSIAADLTAQGSTFRLRPEGAGPCPAARGAGPLGNTASTPVAQTEALRLLLSCIASTPTKTAARQAKRVRP
jgi:hypothetical protein